MRLLDLATRFVRTLVGAAPTAPVRAPSSTARPAPPSGPAARPDAADPTTDYPVETLGLPPLDYAPSRDGDADPGEVVWAWVPFEDDPSQGKDRPVLVVARTEDRLVGLMLSSQDHDRDAADEARYGRYWMDVGSGAWDRQRRPSEVRLDRLLSLPHDGVRREGAALDPHTYAQVAAALRDMHGGPGRTRW